MRMNFYKAFILFVCALGIASSSHAQQCNVIYVTPTGNGTGTRVSPASLTTGLTLVGGTSTRIWMAEGTYPISNALQLVSNVTLEGGFDPVTWIKSNATPTVIHRDNTNLLPSPASAIAAIIGLNKTGFRLQDLTIQEDDAPGSGNTDYGIYLNGCSNYNIVRCVVVSGAGSKGADGLAGTIGAAGSTGGTGTDGNTEPLPNTSGAGGVGGNPGGNGGVFNNYNPGANGNGQVGGGTGGGAAGAGGSGPGCSLGCAFGPPGCGSANPGTAGGTGSSGSAGVTGATGPAGAVTLPGYFVPGIPGTAGTAGTPGAGGGGGGMGGGQQESGADDHGGTGGGGGGGGFGGLGGQGGAGGGGSFAVFLFNDGGGGSITDCQLTAGAAGAGGAGGVGGGGGLGAPGGPGGGPNPVCGSANTDGGAGGPGGAGGAGGAGGPGSAGLSAALSTNGATVTQSNITSVPGNPPVITVQNSGCTNAQVLFTAPTAGAWNFGAGATPATGNGVGPIAVNYSSTGRKSITFSGTNFTDFVDIFTAQNVSNTITQSANPPINGCPDTFHCSIPASSYVWDFGPLALPAADTGTVDSVFKTVFLEPGTYTVSVFANTACCGIVKDSITFTVHPNTLNVSLSYYPDSVCQGTTMTFKASPGTYHTYSFYVNDSLVQTGQTDSLMTNSLKPGDSVIVLGFQGVCYTNPSATIHPLIHAIPPAPTLTNDIPSDTICGGDSVIFTASLGYANYAFSNGSSQQQSGPNNVWITDQLGQGNVVSVIGQQYGCNSLPSPTQTLIIKTTPILLDPTLNKNICQGNSDTISVPAAGPAGQTLYEFFINGVPVQDSTSTNYISSNFSNNDTVWVIASLLGCPSAPTTREGIKVRPTPTVTLTSSAAPSDTVCQGIPVTFTASPATDSLYIFFNGSSLIQNSSSPTYTSSALVTGNSIYVDVINAQGCPSVPSDTITTVVNPAPQVHAGNAPAPVCLSAPAVTLTGFTPAGGVWSGQGITDPANGVVTPSAAGTGTHELTYTYHDPLTGCPGSDSVPFKVNALPVITVVPASPSICVGQSMQLVASGGNTYAWSPATGLSSAVVNNPIAAPTVTSTYELTVTDANSCIDSVAVTVTVNPAPTASFTADEVCANTPTIFTNNSTPANNTYVWNFGDGTTSTAADPTHTYTASDSFKVTLTAQLGSCSTTDTNYVVVFPAVKAGFTANTLVSYNDSTDPVVFTDRSTNATIWNWSFGDLTSSSIQSPSHVYNAPGVYTVTLVASNQFGCIDSLTRDNYIDIYPVPVVFIPNAFTPGQGLANNILKVYSTGAVYFEWVIFDRIGELVYQSNNINDGWDGTYKGKPAAPGVYVYNLKIVFEDNSTRHYKGGVTLLR